MKSTKTGNLNDMDLLHTGLYGGPGGTWTRDTWIFSPLLLPTELPAHIIWTSSTTPRSYASTAGVSFLISVFISLYFRFFLLQDTIFVLQNVGLEPTTYCLSDNCSPIWANLATKLFAVCALYKNTKRKEKSLWFLGCERWDSNPRSPAYEAGDLAACLLRNGCSRRIRTSYPGYEPGVLPLDDHCNIKGECFSGRSPHDRTWKEMNRKSSGWQSGEYFIAIVCNPYWELLFHYPV